MSQTVIVTGASRGLGLSLSELFLKRGDTVLGISKTKKHWEEARKKTGNSERFQLFALDISREEAVRDFYSDIYQKYSAIDILINNAGYASALAKIEEVTLEDLNANLTQNLTTAFLMSKHLLPRMKLQKKGLIVNIASMAGLRSVPRIFAYSAAKFGVVALSQCIAKEYAEENIKSFTVCPGGIHTEMRAQLFGEEDAEKQQSPDFVAGVILDCIDGKIKIDSGGDIAIRHGKVTGIRNVPAP